MRALRLLVATLALSLFAGCSSTGSTDYGAGTVLAGAGGGAGSGGGGGAAGYTPSGPICFLLSCDTDAECADCSLGRTRCDAASHQCLACDPAGGTGCAAGQACSQYGTCVPTGATCPTDTSGAPSINCSKDAQCAPCDTLHQACDVVAHRCVACSPSSKSLCTPSQVCRNDECKDRCPAACAADADCVDCANAASVAHACNPTTHTCTPCSYTTPCSGGLVCAPQGQCIPQCGGANMPKGECDSDTDCGGCGTAAPSCHSQLLGAGKCGPQAAGCSDFAALGKTALPAPFDAITQTCSHDDDCKNAQAGTTMDIGGILQSIAGVSAIQSSGVHYPMNVCAYVSVLNENCGVCVPCRADADCTPVDLSATIGSLFGGMGAVATKFLTTQIFGSAPPAIHFYCSPVAGDYGVCVPCGDPVHACGVEGTVGSGCTSNWDCAAEEVCESGKCAAYKIACTTDPDCTGGEVCAWNGQGYCCRPPGPVDPNGTCVSDTDCTGGQTCSWNGQHHYCMPPLCPHG